MDIYALATVLYELLAGFTPFGGGHPGAVLRRHVTETVVPLPGIPEELWQLLVQCLAKAPASRLRASELATRLRDLLPLLADIPPLDVDEPGGDGAEQQPAAYDEQQYTPSAEEPRRRGAVPLVPGSAPDSNRDTHTSMRVPAPDELAGGPLGTARAPRAPESRAPAPPVTRRRPSVSAGSPWVPRPSCSAGRWRSAAGWPRAAATGTRRAPRAARTRPRRPRKSPPRGPRGPHGEHEGSRGRASFFRHAVTLDPWQSSIFPKS